MFLDNNIVLKMCVMESILLDAVHDFVASGGYNFSLRTKRIGSLSYIITCSKRDYIGHISVYVGNPAGAIGYSFDADGMGYDGVKARLRLQLAMVQSDYEEWEASQDESED